MADPIKDDSKIEAGDNQETADKLMNGDAPDGGGKAEEPKKEPVKAEEPAKKEEPDKKEEPVKAEEPKFELKLPEGSLLDAGAIERTVAFAKEQGLTPKAAQAMLDRESKLLTTNADSQKEAWDKGTVQWLEASKVDKEFGGEAFPKNAELAKRVVERFGTPELMKGLTETGFGNHPELVRLMVRIGKAMDEDQLVLPGAKNTAAPKEMHDVFYPQKKEE